MSHSHFSPLSSQVARGTDGQHKARFLVTLGIDAVGLRPRRATGHLQANTTRTVSQGIVLFQTCTCAAGAVCVYMHFAGIKLMHAHVCTCRRQPQSRPGLPLLKSLRLLSISFDCGFRVPFPIFPSFHLPFSMTHLHRSQPSLVPTPLHRLPWRFSLESPPTAGVRKARSPTDGRRIFHLLDGDERSRIGSSGTSCAE